MPKQSGPDGGGVAMSVIVPAHNEARSIGRLLDALLGSPDSTTLAPGLDVVVVCNGCSDDTAAVAGRYGHRDDLRVVQIPVASKIEALRTGNSYAHYATRAFVDADVIIDHDGLAAMQQAMERTGSLAAGPTRVLDRHGVSLPVRWYYDVWERLPQVEEGLFGRGVVMVSAEGLDQLDLSADLLSDDLAMSEAFAPSQRVVVRGATVTIRLPKTVADLLRRRIRVALGNAQADRLGVRTEAARTSMSDVLRPAVRDPRLIPKVLVFLAVTVIARTVARSHRASETPARWLRDESSRT